MYSKKKKGMIFMKKFFKQLFCNHKWEEIVRLKITCYRMVRIRCSVCGKDKIIDEENWF